MSELAHQCFVSLLSFVQKKVAIDFDYLFVTAMGFAFFCKKQLPPAFRLVGCILERSVVE